MNALITYLNFDGNCAEAMKFYARCLQAELSTMPFSEAPGDFPKEAKDRVMHARLTKAGSPILMASDTMPGMPYQKGTNFSISLDCESLQETERLFTCLGENGK